MNEQKAHKAPKISEEKKQENREKNKLRMQQHRANLSEEQKKTIERKRETEEAATKGKSFC